MNRFSLSVQETEHSSLNLLLIICSSGRSACRKGCYSVQRSGVANKAVVKWSLWAWKHNPAAVPVQKNCCAPQTSLKFTYWSKSLVCVFRYTASYSEMKGGWKAVKILAYSTSLAVLSNPVHKKGGDEKYSCYLALLSFLTSVFLYKIVCKDNNG